MLDLAGVQLILDTLFHHQLVQVLDPFQVSLLGRCLDVLADHDEPPSADVVPSPSLNSDSASDGFEVLGLQLLSELLHILVDSALLESL